MKKLSIFSLLSVMCAVCFFAPAFAAQDVNAVDDSYSLADNSTVVLDVLANDDFGVDGPLNGPIDVFVLPAHGTLSVDDNGTATMGDDSIIFTPDFSYSGADSFQYSICASDESCDDATVYLSLKCYGCGGGGVSGPICQSHPWACSQSAQNNSTGCIVGTYTDLPDTSSQFFWSCSFAGKDVICSSVVNGSCDTSPPTTTDPTGDPDDTDPNGGGGGDTTPTDDTDDDTGTPPVIIDPIDIPYCGNHIVDLGEQCDDGNLLNNDGCNSTCDLEELPVILDDNDVYPALLDTGTTPLDLVAVMIQLMITCMAGGLLLYISRKYIR